MFIEARGKVVMLRIELVIPLRGCPRVLGGQGADSNVEDGIN